MATPVEPIPLKAMFTWRPNRHYQVYLRPTEMLFVYGTQAATTDVPEDLISRHKHSFRAPGEDLSEVRLLAQTPGEDVLFVGPLTPQGTLTFRHRERGRWRFRIPTAEGMRALLEYLPELTSDQLVMNARWDEGLKRYVRSS